jgi:DNA modification methylase
MMTDVISDELAMPRTLLCSDFFDVAELPPVHLVIADPPYGGIAKAKWDRMTEGEAADMYVRLMRKLEAHCVDGAAAYVFWGVGYPGMRPFWKALPIIEETTSWKMPTPITWAKRRAYGIQWSYLFCREEIAYFVKGDWKKPRVFNVPLLEQERGYAGWNKKYPAKSKFKRRTNVWTDVTEVMRNKLAECQKPDKLYRIMVEASSNPGDTVLDPFSGSGTLGRATSDRRVIMVEKGSQ